MKTIRLIEKPEALLVTMSKDNVQEWGGLELLDRFFEFNYRDGSDYLFYYKVGSNIPRFEVLHVYLVIHNMIRWRFNFVEYASYPRSGSGIELFKNEHRMKFWGNFVILCGPTVKMPEDFPFKGFQGFRYSQTIY